MEASDGSEPESDSHGADDQSVGRMNLNHRIQSDFPEAGDAGGDEDGEETELPLFVCQICGCEFEDDGSLETHQRTHRHSTASPANTENSKENIDPEGNYYCRLCDKVFKTQAAILGHMSEHSGCFEEKGSQSKRPRKQSKPKRVVIPLWDSDEIEVLRHLNGKLRKWHRDVNYFNVKLFDKYMAQLVTRKGLTCRFCRNSDLISRHHNKGSMALHYYWRHMRKTFQCEHCNMRFAHRYQVVLHASEMHVRKAREKATLPSTTTTEESHGFLANSLTTPVPDVHKLGMSFFDHSLSMPIIIPTFPPN